MTGTRATPLARAAFAALVAASFLAFFYAQELKGRDPLLKGWTHADVRFARPGGPLRALPREGDRLGAAVRVRS